ncbi:amidoligase family protein [Engelhardtia mirabilis]|uniref:Amidoligase enzyme n=1 Tax=Engelhardtia mirabilis TaxID=2528011 RepID=A0A518BE28_9BACT|nr:Putative amidoligase enzyme [Planctomycetes bacterium Pla133]QDU99552.1 Putative amidoligase enzyme [Planctomycetes bacterium Pla86]
MTFDHAWTPTAPPWGQTESGDERRVGVEIEFIGPDVAQTSSALLPVLGGRLDVVSRYEHVIRGDEAGPWRVELDFAYLRDRARDQAAAEQAPSLAEEWADAALRAGAEAMVPVEVVSPPLPMSRLGEVQAVLAALRGAGAVGTRAGWTYAFGMQLNPEIPRADAATVLAYLRAFLCLQDWLRRESRVDLTRRLTGYTAPFPDEYIQRVVAPGYAPTLAGLMDDYLASNPTRNRPLDFLPLFAEIDEERLRRVVSDERVKARPALHYRLPNCELDEPGWGVQVPWGQWLEVEHLAADGPRLDEVGRHYAAFLDRPFERLVGDWAEEVERWLSPRPGR